MFFFGWGKRNITKAISEKEALVLNYSYFDIFFVFSVAFSYKYVLATLSEQGWHHKPITKEEVDALLKGEKFQPNWWWRYSLFGLLGVVALFVIVLNVIAVTNGEY